MNGTWGGAGVGVGVGLEWLEITDCCFRSGVTLEIDFGISTFTLVDDTSGPIPKNLLMGLTLIRINVVQAHIYKLYPLTLASSSRKGPVDCDWQMSQRGHLS